MSASLSFSSNPVPEIEYTGSIPNYSEGNELTVARVVFDLFDGSGSNEPFDRVSYGFDSLLSKIISAVGGSKAASVKNLDGFWDALTSGKITPNSATAPTTSVTAIDPIFFDQLAVLFATDNVAPYAISPQNKAAYDAMTGDKITFRWRQNINSVRAGQKYRVLLVDRTGKVVKTSTEVAGTGGAGAELTVDMLKTDVEDARIKAGGPLVWAVAGIDGATPVTGVYVGNSLPLDPVGKTEFVIDDTGSMDEEIGAARRLVGFPGPLRLQEQHDAVPTDHFQR